MSAYTDKELAPIEWLLDDLLNTIDDSTAEELHDSYPKLEALVGALKTRQSEWHPTALKQELKQSLEDQVDEILKGIDEDECETKDGWWETSTGAEFGKGRKAKLHEAIDAVFQDKGDNRE